MHTVTSSSSDPKTSTGSLGGETFRTIIYAVIFAVVFRTFCYEPFNIPSESMVPNLWVGDYLFVSKISYGYGQYSAPLKLPILQDRVLFTMPKAGDIAVFRSPKQLDTAYIKRIIGLPGDTMQMRDGMLYINGIIVKREPIEDYQDVASNGTVLRFPQFRETLPNGITYNIVEKDGIYGQLDNTPPVTVPEGYFFAMGDNRDRSADSRDRSVGLVPMQNLIGRAVGIFFSAEDNVPIWQFWQWPFSLRLDRFFISLHARTD